MTEEKTTPNPTMTTEYFLEQVHGSSAIIYWNTNGKTWKNKPSTYAEAKDKLTWRNQQGDDVYYIVNAGGTKKVDIAKINSCFIDWDVGRDPNRQYYPLEAVQERKEAFTAVLAGFPLKPTFVVETRNGYQVYWLVSDCTASEFVEIQKRLIAYFGSDKKVCNSNRALRLPGYYWHKLKSGYPSFYVEIIEHNDVRYSASNLLQNLPLVPDHSAKKKTSKR